MTDSGYVHVSEEKRVGISMMYDGSDVALSRLLSSSCQRLIPGLYLFGGGWAKNPRVVPPQIMQVTGDRARAASVVRTSRYSSTRSGTCSIAIRQSLCKSVRAYFVNLKFAL